MTQEELRGKTGLDEKTLGQTLNSMRGELWRLGPRGAQATITLKKKGGAAPKKAVKKKRAKRAQAKRPYRRLAQRVAKFFCLASISACSASIFFSSSGRSLAVFISCCRASTRAFHAATAA